MKRRSEQDWRTRELNRVALDMCAMEVVMAASRILFLRRHLQASIRWISPVLLDAVPAAQLARALDLLRPPASWPATPLPNGGADFIWRTAAEGWSTPARNARRFMAQFARLGIVLRQASHADGGLAIRVAGEDVEVGLSFGPSILASRKGILRIETLRDRTETRLLRPTGFPIGKVVSHALFDGRDYRIVRSCSSAGRIGFEVKADRVAYELPWRDLLEDSFAPKSTARRSGEFRDGSLEGGA